MQLAEHQQANSHRGNGTKNAGNPGVGAGNVAVHHQVAEQVDVVVQRVQLHHPSGGSVAVNGEIAPMIELGAGFDMDLTARENIFLNGAVLGHDRDYMMAHFDRIIEFSELKDFVDVPVKNFSSGMIARLGFSIATEVQADILVCDEVLAVGDFMFQQKCHRRMEEMLSNGTTLLFVSHDINQVQQLCQRSIWLDHGVLRGDGPSREVCADYVRAMEAGET